MKTLRCKALCWMLAMSGAAFAQGPAAAGSPDAGPVAAGSPDGGPAAVPAAAAEEPLTPAEEIDGCLGCHGRADSELTFPSGEKFSLRVDEKAYLKSSHGKKLGCTDCHADLKGVEGEHPKRPLAGKRQFAIAYSAQCKKCHFSNYTDTLDSVHNAMIGKGRLDAAVCSDCHGAHDITPPAEPRSKISQTCAACHAKISTAFVKSVHGQALQSGSEDVPACTDCHRSHDIADPRVGAWRSKTPELCGNCHTNEKLMAKYKLSTNVVQSYLSDFHGATVKFQSTEKNKSPVVAMCTDCHGVHDITKVKDQDSKVLQANLLVTCQKCHVGATADFPASWLSHYEPSLTRSPLVYLVRIFYLGFIPFMIGGLLLQVILHLWRLVVNR